MEKGWRSRVSFRWAAPLAAAAIAMIGSSAAAPPATVCIPAGAPATIDGSLEYGEWDDALVVLLSDTVTLYMKHADGMLFLGVRAPTMGVGNLLIASPGEIRVLHSSAALGTAVYEPVGDAWLLKRDFTWKCRGRDFSDAAVAERKLFLETEGWVASTAFLGTPGDMEYQVRLNGESVAMLFLYVPVSNPESVLSWPATAEQDVIPGPIPSVAHLDTTQWATPTLVAARDAGPSSCSETPAGTIAFSSSRDGNTDIYMISADGTGLQRVTTNSVQDLEPCWSPDGSRLAYQSRRPAWQIYTMLADGSDEEEVTSRLSWSPSWSPDGLSLAYATGSSIRRVFLVEERLDVLLYSSGDCGRPTWSPDGVLLAFHSNAAGNQDIYVMDARGGTPRRLTQEPSRELHATWSPDGTHLAFASDRDGNLEIYTIRADGSELTRITNHPAEDILPAWSPSGDWIAFVTNRDGNREIYTMRFDGSCVRRLTDNPGEDMYPAWKPE